MFLSITQTYLDGSSFLKARTYRDIVKRKIYHLKNFLIKYIFKYFKFSDKSNINIEWENIKCMQKFSAPIFFIYNKRLTTK